MTLDFGQDDFWQDGFTQTIELGAPDIQQPYVPLWLVEVATDD